MKKLLIILLVLPLLWRCDFGPSKAELRLANDSLLLASASKEIELNKMLESMGSIEENLKTIKEKEQIISRKSMTGEVAGTSADQINEDIKLIYELMVQNKERIKNLEDQMKKAGADNKYLQKIISGLNAQLQEKSEEIARLNEQLHEKNVQIEQLNYTVGGLNQKVDSISTVSARTSEELTSTKDNLNTAYYALGTKKELKEKSIINREGFLFLGEDKVLSNEFEQKYFNAIDIRTTQTIKTDHKKAEILTPHPQGSYELKTESDETLTLVITNAEKFWSISKYLVIQVN